MHVCVGGLHGWCFVLLILLTTVLKEVLVWKVEMKWHEGSK